MPAAVETLAYVESRGTPWHRLGTPVGDLMTADEALVAAGLDWEVQKDSLSFIGFPDKYAIRRSTDRAGLGIVGPRFVPIQNKRAFSFADWIVASGDAKYDTAGSLYNGKKVFLSMELAHLGITVPGDESDTKFYLLVVNGHDGVTPLSGHVTAIRSVCDNTVTAAQKSARRSFKLRHSGDVERKMLAAREALEISTQYAAEYEKLATRLALKKVVDEQVLDILRTAVFPVDPEKVSEEVLAEHPSTLAFENYLTSATTDSIRGTAWGAFNGVVEWLDYGQTYRGRSASAEDTRVASLLWTTTDDKRQALLKALQTV